jgi:hypothetical protein
VKPEGYYWVRVERRDGTISEWCPAHTDGDGTWLAEYEVSGVWLGETRPDPCGDAYKDPWVCEVGPKLEPPRQPKIYSFSDVNPWVPREEDGVSVIGPPTEGDA